LHRSDALAVLNPLLPEQLNSRQHQPHTSERALGHAAHRDNTSSALQARRGLSSSNIKRFVQLNIGAAAIVCQGAVVVVFFSCIIRGNRLSGAIEPDYNIYQSIRSPARMLLSQRSVAIAARAPFTAGAVTGEDSTSGVSDGDPQWPLCMMTDDTREVPDLSSAVPDWMLPEDNSGMAGFMTAQVLLPAGFPGATVVFYLKIGSQSR
jgi:hypothetical protein